MNNMLRLQKSAICSPPAPNYMRSLVHNGVVCKLHAYENTSNQGTGQFATHINAALKNEHNHFKAGFLIGLGLEQLINPCTSIALEYNYTDYGHLNFSNASTQYVNVATQVPVNGSPLATNINMHAMTNSMLFLKFTYYYA